jgi:FkbM family methyltransferase
MIGTISLIGLYVWVFSIASDSKTNIIIAPYQLRHALDCNDNTLSTSSSLSSSLSSGKIPLKPLVPQHDAFTVCAEAQARIESGEWVDPNDRRIYARKVETYPQFYISLHNESFDPVRWRIMTEGRYYEQYVYDRFLHILPNKTETNTGRAVVLDVGANIGYYTLLSAALGHNVVSFEPNPANLLRLCESIRLNGWMQAPTSSNLRAPQLFLLQHAVGDEHGSELMLYTPRNPGMGYLREIGIRGSDTNTTTRQAKTRMIRLDNFADEQGWFQSRDLHIDILKIDVEGKEPQVVLGGRKLLASGLVKHVLTEGRRFGRTNVLDSFVVLYDSGFQLKDPVIPSLETLQTSREKAKAIQLYYHEKLGPTPKVVTDLWWTKV